MNREPNPPIVETGRRTYYFDRLEHYRARGEDYNDSIEWATADTNAKFGEPIVED